MKAWRSPLAALCLVAAVLGLPAGAWAQTFPSDDAGRPAPWCSFLDESVTPAQSVVCSTLHPLPFSTGSASIATDTLGYGRAFFQSASASGTTSSARITTVLFTDEINVVGWGVTGTTTLAVANSTDGGRTWSGLTSIGVAGAHNVPTHAGVTIGTSPRYVLAVSDLGIITSTSPTGGFSTSTFGTGKNAGTVPITFGIQGATVMAWTQGGGANNNAVACRSVNNGQTFQNCVTVDAGVNTAFTAAGVQAPITSPSANTWLAVANNGKVWRSTDDGATWTTVLTLTTASSAAIKCLSATVCLVVDGVATAMQPQRSTDGGATWTAGARIGSVNTVGAALCVYGNNIVDVTQKDNYPSTATGTTTPAYRSADGGVTWVAVTATGGQTAFSGANADTNSDCAATSTGRSAFVIFRTTSTGLYFGPTTANTVQVVGANGIPLNVDGSGNFTANQGLPQATSPNAWGVVPVQGPSLRNSKQTSAVTTANTITIAAVASQRVHLRRIDASCDTGAATATTLTVTDGATQIWALAATETVLAATRTVVQWQPSLDSTTSAAMTITLGACTAGTSLLQVQADQF